MDLIIDKKRDKLLEDYSVGMLKDFYLTNYEKSPQEGFARASLAWSKSMVRQIKNSHKDFMIM